MTADTITDTATGVSHLPERTTATCGKYGEGRLPRMGRAAASEATHHVTLPTVTGFEAWVNADEVDLPDLVRRVSRTAGCRFNADGTVRSGAFKLARVEPVSRSVDGDASFPEVVVPASALCGPPARMRAAVQAALRDQLPPGVGHRASEEFDADAGQTYRSVLDAAFAWVSVR